ncbi:MAG: NADH-quinone oxidoreductase subunit M [Chloroflexi bacterium]|nr:NADH-quinone oxidoreductase subunit M [Chloroflexota bacterium]
MGDISLVSLVFILPLLGVLALIFEPLFERQTNEQAIRWLTLGVSLGTFGLSLLMLNNFDTGVAGLQMEHKIDWIEADGFTIRYYVGVDGISVWMVMLTTFIMPLAILASFGPIQERVRLYYIFLLLMEWAMIGVFIAQDLFLFYVFWEVTLVPMYFLIGIWGAEERIYAAIKFFLYTMAGSLLMLLAVLWLGNEAGTFTLPEIIEQIQTGELSLGTTTERWLFLAFAIAFAIKVPMWPLHSWLPDAHVQAPTAGSVILAGILLKMGTYGFVRFNLPLFPEASKTFAPYIAGLAVIGIIYGAWVSYGQKDVKKLVAYSSISHLGFVMLGIFALNSTGIQGGILQGVNHGISTGGLFLMVGMLYDRRHTKLMAAFGGIWKAMPLFSGISLVIVLSSMGLPGLNGFVGEFTILLGSAGSEILSWWFTAFAALGIIMAAIYMLYMFNTVFMGELDKEENRNLPDLNWQELWSLIPIVVMVFVIGLQASIFFDLMDESAEALAAPYVANPNAEALVELNTGDVELAVALWAISGAVIGVVVTPIIYSGRGRNPWSGGLVGAAAGAAGNLLLLVPLWVYTPALEVDEHALPATSEAPGD